jgi:lipoprotein NlpI
VATRRVDKLLVADTYNYLGIALQGQGKQDEAKEKFSLALDIYVSCEVSESHPGASLAMSAL